jgi:aspartyl-tRNA(Asn)/glutamyl-tRNA(Gln) amidotransferase subunit A
MDIQNWTARRTTEAIASGEVSATEVVRTALDRIAAADPQLHAFTHVADGPALTRAAEIDARGAELAHLPLLGVPLAVKDNMCTRGLPATACSRMLEHFSSPFDASAIARLQAAGAIVIGKTNCDEFAMGSSTENSAFGPTRNPWALERIPGGSSGGSAAAVAARLVPIALGSDTGGSIRQPASFCGIVGLKPTYGRVSRYGLIAFGSSLDQIGPLSRTVEDAALVMAIMSGVDPADATTAQEPVPDFDAAFVESAARSPALRDVRIGVPRALLAEGVDDDIQVAIRDALGQLEDLGAELVDIELPHAPYGIPVYYLIATAEASANLARYDGVRYTYRARSTGDESLGSMYERTRDEGFGAEVKRRIMLGTYVLSAGYYDAYYLKAQQVRTLIARDFDRAFLAVDAVAMPTCPTAAFRLGEKADDPLQMYLADVFTVSANLAGLPGISVPCGFTNDRLPVGLQLLGPPFQEASLLRIARAYERATGWHEAAP